MFTTVPVYAFDYLGDLKDRGDIYNKTIRELNQTRAFQWSRPSNSLQLYGFIGRKPTKRDGDGFYYEYSVTKYGKDLNSLKFETHIRLSDSSSTRLNTPSVKLLYI